MKALTNFVNVISLQTLVVISLACVGTFLCLRYDVKIELPTAIIGIAIVFPIVFSINAAYRRREEALRYFGSLKAHAVALYYAHRDWVPGDAPEHEGRLRALIEDLLQSVRDYFTSKVDEQLRFAGVYDRFSKLSRSMEELRAAGVTSSEVSRANQYLRQMMIEFERMRNIRLYRTPTSLRAYSHVFLTIFPILFAPYFAYVSNESYLAAGYVVAVVYGLVLVSLDNIQEDLENPYDQIGADDLHLDVIEDYRPVLSAPRAEAVQAN